MAVEDRLIPYEILVRFGVDGEPKGAHAQYRRVVTLDGEVLKDEPLPARPLDLKGFPTSRVMSDTTVAALARIASLETELADRDQAIAEAQDQFVHLERQFADTADELAKAAAQVERLQAALQSRGAQAPDEIAS